jgi:hypothetical protein
MQKKHYPYLGRYRPDRADKLTSNDLLKRLKKQDKVAIDRTGWTSLVQPGRGKQQHLQQPKKRRVEVDKTYKNWKKTRW